MMLQVELRPPYGLSNCSTANSSDLATLDRVKKVVRTVNRVFQRLASMCQIGVLMKQVLHAVDS